MWEIVWNYFGVVFGLGLAVVVLSRALREQSRPSASMAWLLAIALIPHVGVPAYILLGGRKLRRMARSKSCLNPASGKVTPPSAPLETETEQLLHAVGLPPATIGNRERLIDNGEDAFRALMAAIEGAQESIHVMTFILGRDSVGREIVAALARKANEGVKVRLLLDALGCIWTRGRFVKPLRDAGGEVGIFMRMLPLQWRWSANLRNHRKIVVVDNQRALIGGMNLGKPYMGPKPWKKRWIDTCYEIEGPVARDLQRLFANDWQFATGRTFDLAGSDELDEEANPEWIEAVGGGAKLQIAPGGPDVIGDPIPDTMITAITDATERVWAVTPYFVPDEGLFRILMMEARKGRDVRIVTPRKSNHPLPDLARMRFLRELRGAGAKIYMHPGAMIHAKCIVVDNSIAISGSANLDVRSLFLNYEVALLSYSRESVDEAARWMESLMQSCEVNELPECDFVRQLAEDAAWLVSPML